MDADMKREAARIARSDEVDDAQNDRLRRAQQIVGMYAHVAPERNLVDELIAERRLEAMIEDLDDPESRRAARRKLALQLFNAPAEDDPSICDRKDSEVEG